jgi:hypothetical protein
MQHCKQKQNKDVQTQMTPPPCSLLTSNQSMHPANLGNDSHDRLVGEGNQVSSVKLVGNLQENTRNYNGQTEMRVSNKRRSDRV